MTDTLWYYAQNDEQFGPVSFGDLKQIAVAGRLSPDDLLWREGMDAWTPAISLPGLFDDGGAMPELNQISPPIAQRPIGMPLDRPRATPSKPQPRSAAARSENAMDGALRNTQLALWIVCGLVVLAGLILFTRAFLSAKDPTEEAAAAAVFATFFIAAYVLARVGEKLAQLLKR